MKPRLPLFLILLVAALGILAGGVDAQYGLLDIQSGPDGGTIADFNVEPVQQAAGGYVNVSVRIEADEGFHVSPESVSLGAESEQFGLEAAGELRFFAADGKMVPPAQEYIEGPFTAARSFRIAADAAAGAAVVAVYGQFVPCQKADGICMLPRKFARKLDITVIEGEVVPVDTGVEQMASTDTGSGGQVSSSDDPFAGKSWLVAIAVAFVVGFGLLLTPCIYPLIPITIGLVGATAERSRLSAFIHSVVYVLGISTTYAVAGYVAGVSGAAFDWLNHPAVGLVLAVLFVAMALAMFDVFTVDLTSQRVQRAQAKLRGKGGLVGLFLVGVLAGVGATACVGPIIVAAFAYVSDQGKPLLGLAMFFAMAWGFGLPLVVLGTFAGMARRLPRPGAWMNTVKHTMGLALLGVAVYYVGESHLLGEAAFRIFVSAFLLGAAVFVGAFDRLSEGSGWAPRARKTIGLLLLAASVVTFARPWLENRATQEQGIQWVEADYAEVAELVQSAGRPVLVDYWTESCKTCKAMFRTTFKDPRMVAASGDWLMLKVDLTGIGDDEWDRWSAEHQSPGVPVLALYDGSGERVRLLTGFHDAEGLLAEMEQAQ